MGEYFTFRIIPVNTLILCPNPEITPAILNDYPEVITYQGIRILGIMLYVREFACVPVKQIYSFISCYPYNPVLIFNN